MEWYEHRHEEEAHRAFRPETPDMSPRQRLELRLGRLFGVTHCHLVDDRDVAIHMAIGALFSPELGERAAFAGDEIMMIAAENTSLPKAVSAFGGRAIRPLRSPDEPAISREAMEAALSMSTRAILVEHTPQCLKNMHTVRDFCNKYDIWLVEIVRDVWQARYEICGNSYAVGAVGDWSVCDLARLGVRGAAILTRDDFISALIRAAIDESEMPSNEAVERALAKLPAGGDAL